MGIENSVDGPHATNFTSYKTHSRQHDQNSMVDEWETKDSISTDAVWQDTIN